MLQLILELKSEEIPFRMQERGGEQLEQRVCGQLKGAGLDHGLVRHFVTPRRLVLVIDDLPERQPERREERRGPRVEAPERAIEGFLRANGLTRDQCEERDTPNGRFLFAVRVEPGRDTGEILVPLLAEAIAGLSWPKSMRWGSGDLRWVRPLERVVCVLTEGDRKVPLSTGLPRDRLKDSGVAAWTDTTSGHRFMAPAEIPVLNFADYEARLRSAFVMLDQEERKSVIREGVTRLAAEAGLRVHDDPGLIDEVAGLVEWPVPLAGQIDSGFMDLPAEVLMTSMRIHQKYFPLLKPDGSLAPRFVVVAGLEADDGGKEIVAGNERVLRARLSDAKFFWDQDRRLPLAERVGSLEDIVFHAQLGSMAHRVQRLTMLARHLAEFVPDCDPEDAARAAWLAKADLVTEMVGEFPELQGVMGRYYALGDGEKKSVADAIAAHYAPAGPSDQCPTAPLSIVVALADKFDTVAGFFAVGEKPTGSRDPYALRRAALGIIRLVVENDLRLPLRTAFRLARTGYDRVDAWTMPEGAMMPDDLENELLGFFADRLKVHLRAEGTAHDHISAVFALGDEDDLVRLLARVGALSDFLDSADGGNLLMAYRRASNIVAIEEKRDGVSHAGEPDVGRLVTAEERDLAQELDRASGAAQTAVVNERYVDAMKAMAALRQPVDRFFDTVTVNSEDPELRLNRLRLLSRFRATLGKIGDFSMIEG